MFRVHQALDRALYRPVAIAYKTVVPRPVRTGLRHILSNLTEPIVFLNDLLQLKPHRALKTLARFVINSTAGIGGVLDVAKTADLPHRDNGLGNTLGRYGVKPGPYIFLPFIGPTTLRDFIGGQADNFVLPLSIGKPFDRLDYSISTNVITGLDLRVESDVELRAILGGAADPYASLRSVFLQSRIADINEIKGKKSSPLLDDPLADPGAAPGDEKPAPAPVTDPNAAPTPVAPTPDAEKPAAPGPDAKPADQPPPPPSSAAETIVSFYD